MAKNLSGKTKSDLANLLPSFKFIGQPTGRQRFSKWLSRCIAEAKAILSYHNFLYETSKDGREAPIKIKIILEQKFISYLEKLTWLALAAKP